MACQSLEELLVPVGAAACIAGEFIFAARDQMDIKLEGVRTSNKKYSGSGVVFLSNLRIVFVASKMDSSGIAAVELPLIHISNEKVNQPILGCNNLSGTATLVEGSGQLQFKLLFSSGGMGTMGPLFYSALEYVRVHNRNIQSQQQEYHPPKADHPPSFVNAACIDPNDPTTVYITEQPVKESDRLATAPPYPVV